MVFDDVLHVKQVEKTNPMRQAIHRQYQLILHSRIRISLAICIMASVSVTSDFVHAKAGNESISSSFKAFRGINLSIHSHPTDSDFDKIAGWGVNLLRLVIHADPEDNNYGGYYQKRDQSINDKAFDELDRVLDMAGARGMRVIIATHNSPGMQSGAIWDDFRYWQLLTDLWSYIALRYRNHSAVIGYAPIDEPTLVIMKGTKFDRLLMRTAVWTFPNEWENTSCDYFLIVERVGQIINRIDPRKIVVVAGVGLWGNPINYTWMRPVNVKNAVYSFNMYIPHSFADSGKKGRPIVGYDKKKKRSEVLKAMVPVLKFAKKYNVSIIVSGFGLTYYSEGMGAADWLHDVIDFFEDNHWSWAYWTYSINFRNPEVIHRQGGSLERRNDTERLTVLREYWSRNRMRTSIFPNGERRP